MTEKRLPFAKMDELKERKPRGELEAMADSSLQSVAGAYIRELLQEGVEDAKKHEVEPTYVEYAFQYVIDTEFASYQGKPGRKPTRFQKIREVFRGRENEIISLDELARVFPNTKDPRKDASLTVFRLNQAFEKYGLNLEIQGLTVTGRGPSQTAYRLRTLNP